MAKPEFEESYGRGYVCEVSGWRISGPPEAIAAAYRNLRAENSPPARDVAVRMARALMAKTRSAAGSVERDALRLGDFCRVLSEYPAHIGARVVLDWDKREGESAIFTPSSAELRRALDEAARPYTTLAKALEGASEQR